MNMLNQIDDDVTPNTENNSKNANERDENRNAKRDINRQNKKRCDTAAGTALRKRVRRASSCTLRHAGPIQV